MGTFVYIADTMEGLLVTGARNFKDKSGAVRTLEDQGLTNIEVFHTNTHFIAGRDVGAKELAIFSRQMSIMFISNITVMEGVVLIAEQTGNKELKSALTEIHELMNRGFSFRQSIGMYPHIFGFYLINMVNIGESSGTLDIIFEKLSLYYEKEDKIRRKLRSATAYPSVLAILMFGIVLLLILKILPMFQSTLLSMSGEVPTATALIFSSAAFIGKYSFVILGILLAIIISLTIFFKTERGGILFDRLKVSIPLSKYVQARIITSRYARSLAILLKSGVQLLNAMEDIIPLIENKYLESRFKIAFENVKNGQDFVDSLSVIKIFPSLFLRMATIGHTTGRLDEMLDKSASIFDDEVDEAVDRMTLMIEPALIIILSVIVGIILLSVMLPMISIMNAIV
jgi:type IV pilus assembly protein PilC